MNILILAYLLSPSKGSEYSVAWNYVTHMSKKNNLTVLYGASGNQMGDCDEMEDYIKQNPIPNVCLIPIYPNKLANILNWPNRHHVLEYTFYYAYRVWHLQVYKVASELMETKHFNLIHYVGMIGYREPGYLWKLGLPYVWGPVGGTNNAPQQLMERMPLIGRMKLTFRSIVNTFQFHTKRRLKKALKATDILLTATSENQRNFKNVHHKDSIWIPENCITGNIVLNKSKFINNGKFNLIVIGRLDSNKNVGILLEALTHVKHRELLHLDIVGDGMLKEKLQQYAIEHDINNMITWHGQLPRVEAVKVFNSAHLHVITSVSEGNPTTIWEAMSYGVPTMSFDHCGMHDTICDRCGIRIPIAKHYEECVSAVAIEINKLLEHPERFQQLAEGTIECAYHYKWSERERFLNSLYESLLSKKKVY